MNHSDATEPRGPVDERVDDEVGVEHPEGDSHDAVVRLDDVPPGSYLVTGRSGHDLHDLFVRFVVGASRIGPGGSSEGAGETPGRGADSDVRTATADGGEDRVGFGDTSTRDAHGPRNGAGVLVSTDAPADAVYDQFRGHAESGESATGTTTTEVGDHCAVVESLDPTGRTGSDGDDAPRSPGDLRAVGLALTERLQQLGAGSRPAVRLGYSSLSTVLMFADTRTVFQFLHVLAGRLDDIGGTALFGLNPAAHDDQTTQTLAHAVDGRIHVEFGETVRIRSSDVAGIPETWTPLSTAPIH